jgi:hypothetical protein
MFGLSNQSMLVSDGTNIQELAIGSDGNQLTVAGGALSWETQIAGDVRAGNLIMANSITIGDYTQPSSATCSSAASISPTYDNGNFGAWATTGSEVTESSNIITFDITTRAANHTVTNDLGSTLSDSAWVLRCKLEFTTITAGGTSGIYFVIGMGDANSSAALTNSIAIDLMALQMRVASDATPTGQWGLVGYNSTGGLDNPEVPEMDTAPTTQVYYVEIKRLSTTSI